MACIDAIPAPSSNSGEVILGALALTLLAVGGGAALWVLYNEVSPLLTDPARDTLDTHRAPLPPNEITCSDCGQLKAPVGTTGLCIDCYQKLGI